MSYDHCAGNCGLGWRTALQPYSGLLGVNLFYDFRNCLEHYFQQVGLGIVYCTCLMDVRVNGYLPIGPKSALQCARRFDYGDGYTTWIESFQTAMWGMDIEFGKHFCCKKWLSLFVGLEPYFYDVFDNPCCSQSLLGGMGRFSTTICTRLNLDLVFTYDRLFKGCTQFQITYSFPCSALSTCFSQFFSRVERNPILITTPTCRYSTNF